MSRRCCHVINNNALKIMRYIRDRRIAAYGYDTDDLELRRLIYYHERKRKDLPCGVFITCVSIQYKPRPRRVAPLIDDESLPVSEVRVIMIMNDFFLQMFNITFYYRR